MIIKRYCKHYNDDATCKLNHKMCANCSDYYNDYILRDCKNYSKNNNIARRERCRYLVDINSTEVPCGTPRFTKSGKRIMCTFYEKGDE